MLFPCPEFQLLPFPESAKMPRKYPSSVGALAEGCEFYDGCLETPERLKMLATPEAPLYFIGDLHGDILALEGIIDTIDAMSPNAVIVVLGDTIDRGPRQLYVVLRLLELIKSRPGRMIVLNGDHEEGVQFDAEDGKFYSPVIPGEFVEHLNHAPRMRHFGIAFAKLLEKVPVAVFFQNGIYAAHGGVPHQDLLPDILTPADLSSPECLRDFIWNRLTDARRKRPNRGACGTEFGYENLLEFCSNIEYLMPAPLKLLVCGHQHPYDGWQFVAGDETHAALCLYSSFIRTRIPGEKRFGVPCFAEVRPGEAPRVYGLELDEEDILGYYSRTSVPLEETS